LEALKAAYGLGDGPLGWQLCLLDFLIADLHGNQSHYDENFIIWFEENMSRNHGVRGLGATHIDDNAVAGGDVFLDQTHGAFVERYGKVSRVRLPFTHCGIEYKPEKDKGLGLTQQEFCQQMTCAPVPSREDASPLHGREITDFRSILGALLWLCLTRLDTIADVSMLQQELSGPTVGHLKEANKVVARAKKYRQGVGLHFRPIAPPYRIVCFGDAGANTKKSQYYREAGLIVLMHDSNSIDMRLPVVNFEDKDCVTWSGPAHYLGGYGRRAKRVGTSTSHGETLAAVGAQELAQLIAARLTEIFQGRPMSLQATTSLWSRGLFLIPVDHATDCKDFFLNATGERPIPQDRGHRLYVACIREMRITGRIRYILLVPTLSMLADALTKTMLSPQLMKFTTAGIVDIKNAPNHPVEARRLLRYTVPCSDEEINMIKSFEHANVSDIPEL